MKPTSKRDVDPLSPDAPGLRWFAAVFARRTLLWRRLRTSFSAHGISTMCSALSFRTIFAMVPMLVVAFLAMKGAGLVEQSKRNLHTLLQSTGLTEINLRVSGDSTEAPAAGEENGPTSAPATAVPAQSRPASAPAQVENLAQNIENMIADVEKQLTFARLGPVTLLLLVWSAITMLTTLERSLNRVFEAPRARPLGIRVLLYWSAMTFVPLVLTAIGLFGALAIQTVSTRPEYAVLGVGIDLIGNFAMGVLLLACVYKFLPNTRVPFKAALLAAVIVMPLWILAKWGFAIYVAKIAGRGSLYRALGLLPLFLIWLNVCWYAFLIGAEIAAGASNLRRLDSLRGDARVLGPLHGAVAAFIVADDFRRGHGATSLATLTQRLDLPTEAARSLLDRLCGAGILSAVNVGEEAYLPAMPAERIRLADIVTRQRTDADANVPADPAALEAMQRLTDLSSRGIGEATLKDLLEDASAGAPPAAAAAKP